MLESGSIPPVTFFVGEDEYLARDLIGRIKRKVLGETPDALNGAESWDGRDHALEDILASADQMVFGGGKKVLVVRRADELLSQESLRAYCGNPFPGTVAVFCLDRMDGRRSQTKTIESSCAVVELENLYEDQRAVEVQRVLRHFPTLKLTDAALDCLRQWVGNDLGALSKELEKIQVVLSDKPLIDAVDIEDLVFRQETQNIFDLVDAVVDRDRPRALSLLIRLMSEGKSALEIFGLLRSQMERLYQAAEMLSDGKPARSVCQAAKIPPFYSDVFLAKARKAGAVDPARFFALLYEADCSIKTGLRRESIAAEMLVMRSLEVLRR